MKYIIGFEEDEAVHPGAVGHKFSSLARAVRIGIPVPSAFAIHTAAHRFYIEHNRWPSGLLHQVTAAAEKLTLWEGLSIRSSATREDLENRSFAGQYQTFLEIVTESDLIRKIEGCWQSAQSSTVLSYIQASGQGNGMPLMAVILQKMVDPIVSGVAFSRNPMNPSENRVTIEATEGLAEKLVSGHISPYRIFINEDNRIEIFTPPDRPGENATLLSQKDWCAIAALVRKMESHNGNTPQDIEWSIDKKKKLWLLQSRSITTLKDGRRPEIPSGVWTRKIADDLWADRLTPFLADTMIRNAHRYDLSRINKIVGIPTVSPTLAMINGYLYVNVAGIEQLLTVIPEKFRVNEIRRFLPPGYDIGTIPSPGIVRLLRFLFRSLILLVLEPGSNPLFCIYLSRFQQRGIRKRLKRIDGLTTGTPAESLHMLDAAIETMVAIQENNQWPYSFANFFTMFFRWLVVDRMGRSHRDFLNLLGHGGNNVTIRIEQHFRHIARKINEYPTFRSHFLNLPRKQVLDKIPEPIRDEIQAFLLQYGSRSRHRTLLFKRWEEEPQEVIGILQSLVQFHTENQAHAKRPSLHGTDNPWYGWNRVYRMLLTPILKLTVRYLDLREDLRFLLDQSLYQIRKAAVTTGKQLGLEEKVFFLTMEELRQMIKGDLQWKDARDIASERCRKYQNPADPPAYYVDGLPSEDISDDECIIKGLGTSLGIVTGCSRIVDDPTCADIAKGDILVASNTDPGWTPILSIVGGMIMEEGGLLNHCSIVARELGIPSIVGVRQATRKIPEGARVTVDGGLGLVRIENHRERPQSPTTSGSPLLKNEH